MSEPEPVGRKDDLDLQVGGEGEPHPAELLVSLVNADTELVDVADHADDLARLVEALDTDFFAYGVVVGP